METVPYIMSEFGNIIPRYYAWLDLYVDPENKELCRLYQEQIAKHNMAVLNDPFPNAGFDMFFPKKEIFCGSASTFVDFGVKCEMRHFDKWQNQWHPAPFYVYPRSSMSKTPLMLANHTGIIDSGYRGNLIGAFRYLRENISAPNYEVEEHTRLLQICSSDLRPIMVRMVELSSFDATSRGSGGFGSTGR